MTPSRCNLAGLSSSRLATREPRKRVVLRVYCQFYISRQQSPACPESPESFTQRSPLVSMTPAILALLILLSALAPFAAAADSKTAVAKAPAQGFSAQDDKFIEATIRAKLAKSKIGQDGFTVRVQGGIAYWEGTTTIPQHKGAATRMAHTAGAPNVINNIKVNKGNQTGSAAPATRTTAAPPRAVSPATTAAPNAATTAAPTSTPPPDSGLRRVQVKSGSSQTGPSQ
jgi:hypothetical protein